MGLQSILSQLFCLLPFLIFFLLLHFLFFFSFFCFLGKKLRCLLFFMGQTEYVECGIMRLKSL